MHAAAIIVAAGRGSRVRSAPDAHPRTDGSPKQYLHIGGRSILRRTVDSFLNHPQIKSVQVVIHSDDRELYAEATRGCDDALRPPVIGGATRQASVLAGLEALAAKDTPELVLIHDAARPFVSEAEISDCLAAARRTGGALVALPLADTLKRGDQLNRVLETIPRAGLWRASTPQGFSFDVILTAHRAAASQPYEFTDDAAVAEHAGIAVALVQGRPENFKITTHQDLAMAEQRVSATQMIDVRTGTGFDVHRFAEGDHVWLCGVQIPHDQRLEGHSDADVGLHALTDAILGAIGDGDIGAHFPPSDPQWKGAASHLFLADAARRVAERGGRISNVDVTLLCEAPRIGPHRKAMRERIAEILRIGVDRVGVKATTTERLGFTGRKEGIAAMASATIVLPSS